MSRACTTPMATGRRGLLATLLVIGVLVMHGLTPLSAAPASHHSMEVAASVLPPPSHPAGHDGHAVGLHHCSAALTAVPALPAPAAEPVATEPGTPDSSSHECPGATVGRAPPDLDRLGVSRT